MCTVNIPLLQNPAYKEKVLLEFKIKKAALSVLRVFLTKCNMLLNQQLWKMLSTFLINAISFFVNHDKEKKEIIALFKQHFSEEEYY
jgi:hypothetical protein